MWVRCYKRRHGCDWRSRYCDLTISDCVLCSIALVSASFLVRLSLLRCRCTNQLFLFFRFRRCVSNCAAARWQCCQAADDECCLAQRSCTLLSTLYFWFAKLKKSKYRRAKIEWRCCFRHGLVTTMPAFNAIVCNCIKANNQNNNKNIWQFCSFDSKNETTTTTLSNARWRSMGSTTESAPGQRKTLFYYLLFTSSFIIAIITE